VVKSRGGKKKKLDSTGKAETQIRRSASGHGVSKRQFRMAVAGLFSLSLKLLSSPKRSVGPARGAKKEEGKGKR
jgi:hypothetical protein